MSKELFLRDTQRAALECFLAQQAGAENVVIQHVQPLSGGTVNENWLLQLDIRGELETQIKHLVLRADMPTKVDGALSRRAEFRVMRAVFAAGVTVPEALWFAPADGPLGREFFLMRYVLGTASPPAIIHDPTLGGPHERLVERLGAELARIHTLTPGVDALDMLCPAPPHIAIERVRRMRALLDGFDDPHPGVEWGLRWLELNAPAIGPAVLVHGDFRTGNYLVDSAGLTAILDWELAGWGDQHEDLAWFLLRFWRLDHPELEAGGIAAGEVFLRAYEIAAGKTVDRRVLAYWVIMANIRWATIALQQARRHLSGMDLSLELCLTGCRAPEPELEALRLIAAAA